MNRRRRRRGSGIRWLRQLASGAARAPRERGVPRSARALVGRDVAPLHRAEERRRRLLAVLVVGGLFAALSLTALRIDLIRQRYALAEAMRTEKKLLEQRRLVTARVRSLRDPARLAELARERGFVRPSSVLSLEGADDPARDVALGPRP
jgi:hypothetical protein